MTSDEAARYEAEKKLNRIAGGQKSKAVLLARNPNFYKEIGAKGGSNGHTSGFYMNRELARAAGAKGGAAGKPYTRKARPS